jgi:OmcA/MtrC family decaheme c-type cytochrome
MKFNNIARKAGICLVVAVSLVGAQQKHHFSPREKAFYADAATVEFVNPGLAITVTGATIVANGTITAQYTLTDPTGLPLDSAGVNTPGAISTSFLAGVLTTGQDQYTNLTTRATTGTATGAVNLPSTDSGGATTALGNGAYQYVFKTNAPTGFDATATYTIGIYGSRTLTAYNLPNNYASTTFNFVPNGAKVTHTRDVIETASCNQCHEQLSAHGGSRRGVNLCVMCHTPQMVDPTTGNSLDFKVYIHKIHMGSSLPSVVAGGAYQITSSASTNFSTVVDPANVQRCEVCHQQTTGAAQATAFMKNPSRAACGSCHDDVSFVTGKNHPGGFQTDDTQCANCHIPLGETPFDASIMGAHVMTTDTAAFYARNPNTLLSGINLAITSVTNNQAGSAPVVAFTLLDNNKNPLALTALGSLSFTMAGPTTDFGYTIFGAANAGTPGYVTESAQTAASCDAKGNCTYAFTNVIPAKAVGTYAIGGEARITQTILAGTMSSQSVQYGAFNPVSYFSVDGSPVETRRTIVQMANCNTCHVALSEHGGLRSNVQYCVFCHNPSNTDASTRATATVASDKAAPPQGINFNLLVHRIHNGVNVTANGGKPFIVVGHGGSHNDFSGVLFPGLSPTGSPADLANCAFCHVNSSEQNDLSLTGLNPVTDPQGLINPVQPVSSACSGCHVDLPTASHFLANTTTLGESCAVCHGTNGAFTVDSVHANY